jgi:hypothetical protein
MAHGFEEAINKAIGIGEEDTEQEKQRAELNAEASRIVGAVTAASNSLEALQYLQQQAEQLFGKAQQMGISIDGYNSAADLVQQIDEKDKEESVELEQDIPSFFEDPFGWMAAKGEQYMEKFHEGLGGVAQANIKQRAADGYLPKEIEQVCEAKGIAKEQALELVADGGFEALSNIEVYSGERAPPSAAPSMGAKSKQTMVDFP